MDRKYFPYDKNYLLKEAQASRKEALLQTFIQEVKTHYQRIHNPLGLVDDTIQRIQESQIANTQFFEEFYDDLAAIYRYKYGEVQLEFLWDGTSHREKYEKEWEKSFLSWTEEFCSQAVFIRAVFELTVFYQPMVRTELVQNRLRNFLFNYFELKIYCYRGIQEVNAVA